MVRLSNFTAIVLTVASLGTAAQAMPGGRVGAGGLQWKEMTPGVRFAPAYGDWERGAHGKFVSMDNGASLPMHSHSDAYHGMVVDGRIAHISENGQRTEIPPGSYFHIPAGKSHGHECVSSGGCSLYTHSDGSFGTVRNSNGAFNIIQSQQPLGASSKTMSDGNKVPAAKSAAEETGNQAPGDGVLTINAFDLASLGKD